MFAIDGEENRDSGDDQDLDGIIIVESNDDTSDADLHDLQVLADSVRARRQRRNALAHIMDEDNEYTDIQEEDESEDDEDDEDDGDREEDLLTIATHGRRRAPSPQPDPEPNPSDQNRSVATPQTSTSKRKQTSPVNSQTSKKSRDSLGSDDDADCCSICFEPWSNSGTHKLTSLKCGHIFGQKCIERWIKDAKKCPQCNTKAKKADIRVLYAKRLKAIDTTELTEATNQYEAEKDLRRKKEMELAKVQMQYQIAMTEVNRLKSEIEDLKNNQVVSYLPHSAQDQIASTSSSGIQRFSHLKNILISPNGNCRVMDFHADSLSLAISQPSPHTSFMSGFGLKKFSVADMKSSQFNILHTKVIKDVRFSPHNGLVLTASQDESLKITNWDTNSHVHTYKPQRPVWCCCWDSIDCNLLYAGLSNGSIHCYDMRYTTDVLHTISNPLSRCPIVTMYNIPRQANPDVPGGLLVQTFEGVTYWQQKANSSNSEYEPHMLPLQPGNCAGLQYSNNLKHCLITYRPGRSYKCTTHVLCQLGFSQNESYGVACNIVETYRGGQTHKMLARNALFSTESTGNVICVGDEAKNMVNIYEAKGNGNLLQGLVCSGPALDILPLSINETNFLATLSDKELKIYEQK